MKKLIIYSAFICLGLFPACNEYDIFEEELYEKNIYLISDRDHIFSMPVSLDVETAGSEVSIGCSGTLALDRDIRITLERDTLLLDKYNYSNFDIEESRYAKELKPDQFSIPSMSVIMRTENPDSYETLPVYFEREVLETLSPDSIYFIPLTIKDISDLDINEAKRSALYRIYPYNSYAETETPTYYTMKGYQSRQAEDKESVSGISASKILHPLSTNKVRMFVGNVNFNAELEDIEKYAIVIEINEDNTLQLYPYVSDSETLQFYQLDPATQEDDFLYQNIYLEKEKRFLLYYQYRVRSDDGSWGNWMTIRESVKKLVEEEEVNS